MTSARPSRPRRPVPPPAPRAAAAPARRDRNRRAADDRYEPEPDDGYADDEDYGPEEPETGDAAAAQDIEANRHYVTVALVDEPVRVIPPGAWRQSWQTALAQGNFPLFAEKVIHPDDLDLYYDIDPTNDEFGQFVQDAGALAGESLGKSRGRGRSSRSTRRR
jgi:hypothetical protein